MDNKKHSGSVFLKKQNAEAQGINQFLSEDDRASILA